ncbi:hypothetical protein EV424DRAFT_1644355 [Suillus variegatus]|nr:hypothetical protein EV424DRAFT_1644355 [Suillus variegatus]
MSSKEQEAQILGLGTPCSYPHCSLLDFLPFKCPHCPGTPAFCSEHFHPHCTTAHAHLDRVAPNCPLCSVPVAIPPGEDPNVRMERHISRFCEVMNASGRQQGKGGSKICARGKCGKVLFAPIGNATKSSALSTVSQMIIAVRRSLHNGRATSSTSKPSIRPSPVSATPSSSSAKSTPMAFSYPSLRLQCPNAFSKTDRVSPAPVLSTSPTSTSASPLSATKPPSPIISPKPTELHQINLSQISSIQCLSFPHRSSYLLNLTHHTIRAKEERASRLKAMKERANRGLLTEEEKLILAQEEAARAHEVRKGD